MSVHDLNKSKLDLAAKILQIGIFGYGWKPLRIYEFQRSESADASKLGRAGVAVVEVEPYSPLAKAVYVRREGLLLLWLILRPTIEPLKKGVPATMPDGNS